MPRNMSFAMTTKQVRNQSKTVTRRCGWWFLKFGEIVQPVEKGMGLKKGEKVKRIGKTVRVLSARPEPLYTITKPECVKEGFPDMTPEEFVEMFMKANKVRKTEIVNRIEFEYL